MATAEVMEKIVFDMIVTDSGCMSAGMLWTAAAAAAYVGWGAGGMGRELSNAGETVERRESVQVLVPPPALHSEQTISQPLSSHHRPTPTSHNNDQKIFHNSKKYFILPYRNVILIDYWTFR